MPPWTCTTTSPASPTRTGPWGWRPPTTSPALHEPLRRPTPFRGRTGWARNAAVAARIAANRPELWLPGSLAAIAFVGWLPFLLAVFRVPGAADLEFWGANLASASTFPLNLVVLGLTAGLVLLVASVLVAAGEAQLQSGVDRQVGRSPGRRSLDAAALRLWVVEIVAAVPAMAALAVTVPAIAGVAPAEYQAPDIGGTVLVRIARDVWPELAGVAIAVVFGIAWGAAAQRAAVGPTSRSLLSAIGAGAWDAIRHPLRSLGLSLVTLAALAGWLLVTGLLLRVLWRPIGSALAGGHIGEAAMPLLLVGFVAIWLCLIAAGGALHAWASAWWTLELAQLDGPQAEAAQVPAEEAQQPWS